MSDEEKRKSRLFWTDLEFELDRVWDHLSTKYTKTEISQFLSGNVDLIDAFEEWYGEGDDEEDTSEEDTGREGSRETSETAGTN